jgi:hypothetical protein
MPAIQRARQSDAPLRQLAPRALPRVATDGGRSSASPTPTIGLEHAEINKELMAVGVGKETEIFFFRNITHSLELLGAIRRVPKHCHVDGGDIETKKR